jgi:anti-sigma B factor antagonist
MPDFGITYQGPMTFFLEGELDIATVPTLTAAMSESIGQGGPLTLDLSGLTFVDSTGVAAILKAGKDHLPKGCIVLHGVHDGARRVVDLMGIEKATNIHILPCPVAA